MDSRRYPMREKESFSNLNSVEFCLFPPLSLQHKKASHFKREITIEYSQFSVRKSFKGHRCDSDIGGYLKLSPLKINYWM